MLKILALPILMLFHPMHMTLTSIDYIRGTDSLKVLVRINYDQFLQDYQQTIDDDIELPVLRSYNPFPADMANHYINSKIFIYTNKKRLYGKLLKTKVTDGNIRLNILYRLDKKPKSLTVKNTILTGLYSNVENITIIKINDFETGVKFTQEHKTETFNLQ